jgi:hypothetical protein
MVSIENDLFELIIFLDDYNNIDDTYLKEFYI